VPRAYRNRVTPENLSSDLKTAKDQLLAAPKVKLKHPTKGKKRGAPPRRRTAEGIERQKAGSRKRVEQMREGVGLRTGVPTGFSGETIAALRPLIQIEAEKITKVMTEKLGVDDEYAKSALEYVVGVVKGGEDVESTQHRIAAAKIILDFTKQKPASKSEVAISKAEDFLKAIMNEEANGPGTDEGAEAP